MDVVLEGYRDAVKRPAHLPARPFGVQLVRLGQGVGVDGDGRVQPLFMERNADEVLRNQLARREFPALHRRLQLQDAGFDYREPLGARLWRVAPRERQQERDGQQGTHIERASEDGGSADGAAANAHGVLRRVRVGWLDDR